MLGVLSYYIWLFSTADGRVSGICTQIVVGMSRQEVAALAARSGLTVPTISGSSTRIFETATSGRFGCQIEWQNGTVVTSTYDSRN